MATPLWVSNINDGAFMIKDKWATAVVTIDDYGVTSHPRNTSDGSTGKILNAINNMTINSSLKVGRYYATSDAAKPFVVGNGTSASARSTAFAVAVDGCSYTQNGLYETSDIRKKNIIDDLDLDKAYDLIDKCQTILYELKDDATHKASIGMIAQEIEEIYPELVQEDPDGYKSLDYSRLTVVIIKVLKDIINRVKNIENKVN